jgi:hypothetical protein
MSYSSSRISYIAISVELFGASADLHKVELMYTTWNKVGQAIDDIQLDLFTQKKRKCLRLVSSSRTRLLNPKGWIPITIRGTIIYENRCCYFCVAKNGWVKKNRTGARIGRVVGPS